MEAITFKVQGSAREPYNTDFSRTGTNIAAYCSCPAGKVGQLCKHRLSILQGDTKSIVSGNDGDVQTVMSWVKGTDVEDVLRQFHEAETRFDEAKKQLDSLKRRLARALVIGSKSRMPE
jgi:hypothetical protein